MLTWLRMNYPLRNEIFVWRQRFAERTWDGSGPSPHPVKQRAIRKYAAKYNARVLVETGTFYGDMVEAMRDSFDRIYSIELSPALHKKAQRRFRGCNHIELICGDSAGELGRLVPRLNAPALFWLDGHYSGGITAKGELETPIYHELSAILESVHKNVTLIDDARLFGTNAAYPTVEALEEFISKPVRIENDAIVIEPASS